MPNIFTSIHKIYIALLMVTLFSNQCFANDDVALKLLQRIENSKQSLNTIQNRINRQSTSLNSQLSKQLNDIESLRTNAAGLQRLADEQLISFEALKTRVDLWSAQSNYQKQLLSSYLEGASIDTNRLSKLDGEPLVDIHAMDIIINDITHKLTPSWQLKEIVNEQGRIENMDFLKIGPIDVAFSQASNIGGPVTYENSNQAKLLNGVFGNNEIKQLVSLKDNKTGLVTFDPTLGNAYKIMNQGGGIIDHLQKGGVWAVPIIFFGIFSLIVSIIKAFQLMRLPKIDIHVADKLKELLHGDETATQSQVNLVSTATKGAQKNLIDIAMKTQISQERDDLLVAYLIEYKHKIERFLGAIATSAAIAPLLGLLGTVSGMISTFMMMKTFGTSDASTVSGGISEALITTELGLIVAIPSLIMSALLSRKTKSYSAKLEANAIKLSKINFT